jgi:hypothetical protein
MLIIFIQVFHVDCSSCELPNQNFSKSCTISNEMFRNPCSKENIIAGKKDRWMDG